MIKTPLILASLVIVASFQVLADRAFADPAVNAIVIDPLNTNTSAHRFYHRLGFRDVGRQVFNDEDDCLVMRLDRATWEARA